MTRRRFSLALLLAAGAAAGARPAPRPADWKPAAASEIRLAGEIVENPVVFGSLLLAATREGAVFGIDPSRKAVIWTCRLPHPIDRLTGTAAGAAASCADGRVSAVDGRGAVLWSARFEGELSAPPAVLGSALAAALRGGSLAALSIADGRTLWMTPLAGGAATALSVSADAVYALDVSGGLVAADRDGRRLPAGREIEAAASLAAGQGFLLLGRSDGVWELRSLPALKSLWRRRLGSRPGAAPLADGRRLYAPSRGGVLFALDRGNGTALWWRALPSPSLFRPFLWNGALVASSRSRVVQAFDPADGRPLGAFTAPFEVRAQPLAVADALWLPLYDPASNRTSLLILKTNGGPAAPSKSGGTPS